MDKYFLVDWRLSPAQPLDLRSAQRAIDEAGRRLTEQGEQVRCLHSTYVPAQRRWVCLFAATSEDAVRRTHEIAQLPAPSIETALHVSPADQMVG